MIAVAAWRALAGWGGDAAPFLAAMGLFLHVLSRHRHQPVADDRAGPLHPVAGGLLAESTQAFLLIGTLLLLPVILMYTAWSYWVFRGKMRADMGYH